MILAVLWQIYSIALHKVHLQCGHLWGGARAKMATTARRIAGRLGCGGPVGFLFSPARFGEATALQVGVCDHCHQRMSM